MAETTDPNKKTPPEPPKEKPKRVQVICEDTLGHLLLKKGDTTDDETYVNLLKTKRGRTLVQEVK